MSKVWYVNGLVDNKNDNFTCLWVIVGECSTDRSENLAPYFIVSTNSNRSVEVLDNQSILPHNTCISVTIKFRCHFFTKTIH